MNKKTILFASLLLGGLPLMGTLSADAAAYAASPSGTGSSSLTLLLFAVHEGDT